MPTSKAEKLIKRNYKLYSRLTKNARFYYEKNEYEKALQWMTLAVTLTFQHHPGVFADGKLENVALEIGKKLDDLPSNDAALLDSLCIPPENSSRKRVLHVASVVYNVGGHTRLIKNWINAFPDFDHSLLLTTQNKFAVPEFLSNTVKKSGGNVFVLPPKASFLTKARMLRRAARSNFDYILLHHHPDDVVPVIALAVEDCPPTAVINHADHLFWLGMSVTDLVVDFCRLGERLSNNRRFARNTVIVPYLLDVRQSATTRAEARRALGIAEDETVLITVGSPYKYRPIENCNFFATAKKLLEENPSARLFLVGPDESCARQSERHERMVFLGLIDDAKLYQTAADIYLDGFPLGGGMSAVESVLMDNCPVFSYCRPIDSSARKLLEFEGLVDAPASESEYIAVITELIENPKLRKETTEKLRAHILFLHDKAKFKDYGEKTFGELDKKRHRAIKLPAAEPRYENEDVWLMVLDDTQPAKFPLLLDYGWRIASDATVKDYLKLFMTSLKEGDTNFTYAHLRAWVGTMTNARENK